MTKYLLAVGLCVVLIGHLMTMTMAEDKDAEKSGDLLHRIVKRVSKYSYGYYPGKKYGYDYRNGYRYGYRYGYRLYKKYPYIYPYYYHGKVYYYKYPQQKKNNPYIDYGGGGR